MDPCCVPEGPATLGEQRPVQCPSCRQPARAVDSATVKALLAVSLRRVPPEASYRFCRSVSCAVVYFATDHVFTQADLRVPVHQKRPHDPHTPVCYCFAYTPHAIRQEWLSTGRSTVVAEVTTGVQVGQCACELRNPQGTCCLGNVRAVVKSLAR